MGKTQAPFTQYNLLSNWLSNRFDKRLYHVYEHSTGCQTHLTTGWTNSCSFNAVVKLGLRTLLNEQWLFVQHSCQTGCQTGCTTRFDNRLNEQLFVQHGCQTGLTTGLTTGWMFVYTVQPVVKPVVQLVWQPVWQLVVSCKWGIKIR